MSSASVKKGVREDTMVYRIWQIGPKARIFVESCFNQVLSIIRPTQYCKELVSGSPAGRAWVFWLPYYNESTMRQHRASDKGKFNRHLDELWKVNLTGKKPVPLMYNLQNLSSRFSAEPENQLPKRSLKKTLKRFLDYINQLLLIVLSIGSLLTVIVLMYWGVISLFYELFD